MDVEVDSYHGCSLMYDGVEENKFFLPARRGPWPNLNMSIFAHAFRRIGCGMAHSIEKSYKGAK